MERDPRPGENDMTGVLDLHEALGLQVQQRLEFVHVGDVR